jgi:hypothetical protein
MGINGDDSVNTDDFTNLGSTICFLSVQNLYGKQFGSATSLELLQLAA